MGFLSILFSVFKFISIPFKAFASLASSNPKVAIALVAVLLALYGAYKSKHYIDGLHKEVATEQAAKETAIEERDKLQTDLNTAVAVNADDQAVIAKMKSDQEQDAVRINDLADLLDKNTKSYDNLVTVVQASKSVDDGVIAKVLADTIRTIQQQRSEQQ